MQTVFMATLSLNYDLCLPNVNVNYTCMYSQYMYFFFRLYQII